MPKTIFKPYWKSLLLIAGGLLISPVLSFAAAGGEVPTLGPVRIEFILFAITLICVAVFHHKTMQVALVGLAVVLAFKLIFDPSFNIVEHIIGGDDHEGEWRVLLNLLGLLFGFAILAKHFAESRVPEILPNYYNPQNKMYTK